MKSVETLLTNVKTDVDEQMLWFDANKAIDVRATLDELVKENDKMEDYVIMEK